MKTEYDAIVVGGGIVGASAGYHLARAGVDTLLVDRHDPGRATSAGAGILAPEISGRDEAWFHFAVASVAYYSNLLPMLDADGGGDTGYDQCGLLLVAATEDERSPFTKTKATIFQRQQERDTPSVDDLYEISPGEAKELFPPLAHVLEAIYFRNAARVDGRLMESALRRAAAKHELATLAASVESLLIENGTIRGVRTTQGTFHTQNVLIAGGAWSPALGQQLQVDLPVAPQRGQIAHLDLPNQETGKWPIVDAFHGHYIVCWPGRDGAGRVVVGATRETGSGYQSSTSVSGVIETMSEALRVAPGLADAHLHEFRVGLRPYSADGLPFLGPVPGKVGAYIATGHGPTGLQLGPFSGKLMAELICGHPVDIDLHPFRIDR
ncbi:MAG: FAD-binding oxidoreductase [Chloroflexota bacterium]